MWAVPSPLPVPSLSFLFLSTIKSLLSCPLFSNIPTAVLCFSSVNCFNQWGSFPTAEPADCILPELSESSPSLPQLYIPLTVYLIYFSYHLPLSFSSHFSVINVPLLYSVFKDVSLKKKNFLKITAFFSWLEHPPPTHPQLGDKCFSWLTGFSSKLWAKKSEMASICNQRLFFVYLSVCSLKWKVF